MKFPRLYAIIDRATLDARGIAVRAFAEELREGGVTLVQYRDKKNGPQEILHAAKEIADVFSGAGATLILNDRADLAAMLGWGVHVGQGDLGVEDARKFRGIGWVGVSTHTEDELRRADPTSRVRRRPEPWQGDDPGAPDYIAIGPVFATQTKADTELVVGLEGVRHARALTRKPLVAIGGITLTNRRSVFDAGADSVAVISGLLVQGRKTRDVAREFLAE